MIIRRAHSFTDVNMTRLFGSYLEGVTGAQAPLVQACIINHQEATFKMLAQNFPTVVTVCLCLWQPLLDNILFKYSLHFVALTT